LDTEFQLIEMLLDDCADAYTDDGVDGADPLLPVVAEV
jgi:hypothetical protein